MREKAKGKEKTTRGTHMHTWGAIHSPHKVMCVLGGGGGGNRNAGTGGGRGMKRLPTPAPYSRLPCTHAHTREARDTTDGRNERKKNDKASGAPADTPLRLIRVAARETFLRNKWAGRAKHTSVPASGRLKDGVCIDRYQRLKSKQKKGHGAGDVAESPAHA